MAPHPECMKAVNYTQSWRMDHNGTDKKPNTSHSKNGYACDFYSDSPWFRFAGDGGSQMMNSCVPMRSCGAFMPFWTDDAMPQAVGVIKSIKVYGSYTKCRAKISDTKVMRCSTTTPNDFIYKYDDSPFDTCFYAFCGMK
ncbi:uromodulin-like [Watersipora subatra]|uniref:uromodulin-like n=1 Tax=Watersipora subatra TaxID=2589382 RepID=UPI00355AEE21